MTVSAPLSLPQHYEMLFLIKISSIVDISKPTKNNIRMTKL